MKPDGMAWFRAALALLGGLAVGSGLAEIVWGVMLGATELQTRDPFDGLALGGGLGMILAARELRIQRPRP